MRFEIENTSSESDDIAIKVSDISFSGVKTGATCTYTYNTGIVWTGGEYGNYSYDLDNSMLLPAQTKVLELFVIPQSNDKTITFTIESYKKDANDEYKIPTGTQTYNNVSLAYENNGKLWNPGWVYNYLIKSGGTASYIHFDAAVSDWFYDFNNNNDNGTDDDILLEPSSTSTP